MALDPPLLLHRPVVRLGPTLLPHVEDSILDEAHVAGCRLQERQFVHERAFERGLAHVHRSALALAVVVRVVAIAALRPTTRERPAADFATDESAQWEVRMVPLPRTGHDNAAVENGLRAVERGLIDERLEVALRLRHRSRGSRPSRRRSGSASSGRSSVATAPGPSGCAARLRSRVR